MSKPVKEKIKGAKPTLFIILDGFGLANIKEKGNAITPETAPHIFSYMKEYPSSQLIAHGRDVGLFPGQVGNSEAGHLNIGAGRVVKQDIVMVSDAIKDGTFFKNETLHQGMLHAQEHASNIHIMGLLTDGNSAHAHPDHVYALLEYCRKQKAKHVFLHLFTDGRDSTPHSAIGYLSTLEKHMKNGEKIDCEMIITGIGVEQNNGIERKRRMKHWWMARECLPKMLRKQSRAPTIEAKVTSIYSQQ